MKERWFNYRPICLVFAFLLLGSIFSFYITTNQIITTIITVLVAVLLLVIAILKKKPKYALIPLIAFVIGVSFYYGSVLSFNKAINNSPTTIQARIYNISNEANGMIIVETDSCVFDDKKVNDNLIIYIYDKNGLFNGIEIGSIVKFKPNKFYKSNLFFYETPNSNLFSNDLKYTTSVFIEDINIVGKDTTIAEKIKEQIRENLHLGLTNENAEIAYSALFGDKEMLSQKQYSAYKLSGVAHLLAVSGLHVGIIVAILNKFLKICRIKKWWKLGIVSIFLLAYAYLCGFSVSVVRASIMSIVMILASILKREYDPFNAISLAGIVIFVMNPLCIFDVSFLLSFSCIIGITMLFMPIQTALQKTKMPTTIVDSVAMSLSTTITIVFVMAYFFRTLNIISILANVILIPIFVFAFTVIFVLSFVSLLLSHIAILLNPINYILNFINLIATMLGNLSFANLNTLEFNYIATLLYFVLLLFLGRFCTTKRQYKVITTLPMVALLFYCLL